MYSSPFNPYRYLSTSRPVIHCRRMTSQVVHRHSRALTCLWVAVLGCVWSHAIVVSDTHRSLHYHITDPWCVLDKHPNGIIVVCHTRRRHSHSPTNTRYHSHIVYSSPCPPARSLPSSHPLALSSSSDWSGGASSLKGTDVLVGVAVLGCVWSHAILASDTHL